MAGALVDPNGHKPQLLTQREYEELAKVLAIRRADTELSSAFRHLIDASDTYGNASAESVLSQMVKHYLRHDYNDEFPGAVAGVLSESEGNSGTEKLTPDELETLFDTLKVIRLDTWFSLWLKVQVRSQANTSHVADRHPSPVQIMATLTNDAEEFDQKAEVTRDFLKLRPDLFHDVLPEVPTPAPAEPTVGESLKRAEAVPPAHTLRAQHEADLRARAEKKAKRKRRAA